MANQRSAAPSKMAADKVLAMSPSDLTFLLGECERCFYNKIRNGQRLPRQPIPAVFTEMDRLQRDFFHLKPTGAMSRSLPNGIINCHPAPVLSAPYLSSEFELGVRFRGALDAGLVFMNSFGVADFKTTNPRAGHVDRYRHQLHAYAFALENPAAGTEVAKPVTRLGLLCFYPTTMTQLSDGRYGFLTDPTWIEVPRNDGLFNSLMAYVLELVNCANPPRAGASCPRCSG